MSLQSQTEPPRFLSVGRIAPLIPYLAVGVGLFGTHNAWVATVAYHLGMFLVLRLDHQWYAIRNPLQGGPILFIILVALLSGSGGYLLYLLAPFLSLPQDLGWALAQLGLRGPAWPAFILYFSAVNSWLEELYWRGYLGSPSTHLISADFWFAGYHLLVLAAYVAWPWLILTFIGLVGVAWSWRQVTRLSNGLLIAAVSHLAADVSIMLAIYLLASR